MMQQTPKTSEYSNECREQVIRAMKVEQEIRASKPNANTENFFEVRAPSSTSPPSPEGFLTTITSQRVTITPEQGQVEAIRFMWIIK